VPQKKTFTIKLPKVGSIWRHRKKDQWIKVYSIWSDKKGFLQLSFFITDHDGRWQEGLTELKGHDISIKQFFETYKAK
jgi:hypothetical protein